MKIMLLAQGQVLPKWLRWNLNSGLSKSQAQSDVGYLLQMHHLPERDQFVLHAVLPLPHSYIGGALSHLSELSDWRKAWGKGDSRMTGWVGGEKDSWLLFVRTYEKTLYHLAGVNNLWCKGKSFSTFRTALHQAEMIGNALGQRIYLPLFTLIQKNIPSDSTEKLVLINRSSRT